MTARRGQHAIPGALGSAFIAAGSLGVGWFPLDSALTGTTLVTFLQGTTVGLALARSLVVVGAALVLQTWLIVGADIVHGQITDVGYLLRTAAAWFAPILLSVPLFSRDVYSYYMQGRLLSAGFNPYTTGVAAVPGWFASGVDPMWAQATTPYGPGFLLVERAIATLWRDSPLAAAYAFRVVALLGVTVTAAAVVVLARSHGLDQRLALWLALLNPLVLMHLLAGAHNDALMAGLVAAGLASHATGRPMMAITLVTLALAVKPVAAVALPFVVLRARPRDTMRTALAGGLLASIILMALSAAAQVGPLGWLDALGTPASVRSWLSPSTALGLVSGGLLRLFGVPHAVDTAVTVFRGLGLAALGVTLSALVATARGRSATRSTAVALLALVALGPVVQPWYLLWSLPLFAASGVRHMRTVISVISLLTIHGIANSSATADTFLELSDGVAMLVAAVILAGVVAASRRERELLATGREMTA